MDSELNAIQYYDGDFEPCRKCRNARRTNSSGFSVFKIMLCMLILFDHGCCASITLKKDEMRLSQCKASCLERVSRQHDSVTSECKGNAVCAKCINYCSLLVKKSHVKRKFVCDSDRRLCDEGCSKACAFFATENETYNEASDKAFLKKKQKKSSQMSKLFPKVTKLLPSVEVPTEAKVEDSTSTEPKILPDWRISLVNLERRGPMIQAALTWDDVNPAPSDVYTPDPVLAYLGMANGKYRLHWSCNNLEGQLVTDSTSATVSMWPDCKVLVNVMLLGYNLQSTSILADTGSKVAPEVTTSPEISAQPQSSDEAYSSPVRFDPIWKNILYIVATVEVAISLIVLVALLISRRTKRKESLQPIPVQQPQISCIVVQ